MGLAIAAVASGVVLYFAARWCASLFFDQRSPRFRLVFTLVVTLLLVSGGTWLAWATTYRNDHVATCKVTKADRGGTDGTYRVYTSNCGQLSNEDSVLRWKQNSADLWEQIPANGGVCTFQIAGSRWPDGLEITLGRGAGDPMLWGHLRPPGLQHLRNNAD